MGLGEKLDLLNTFPRSWKKITKIRTNQNTKVRPITNLQAARYEMHEEEQRV